MANLPWRNAVVLPDGRINCEIQHPNYGWIPFTADPNDGEPAGRLLYTALQAVPNKPVLAATQTTPDSVLAARRDLAAYRTTLLDKFLSGSAITAADRTEFARLKALAA